MKTDDEAPIVYWDSCCFIGRITREPNKIGDLEPLTKLAENGKLVIVTSTLTIAEVLQDPPPEIAAQDGFSTIKDYFEHPWIRLREPDRRTMELAADIRRDHKLKLGDAIHVATALRWREKVKILEIHTYDCPMQKKSQQIGNPPIGIVPPKFPQHYPLFDGPRPTLKLVTKEEESEPEKPLVPFVVQDDAVAKPSR